MVARKRKKERLGWWDRDFGLVKGGRSEGRPALPVSAHSV